MLPSSSVGIPSDDKGRIQAGKNRVFFSYLFEYYQVDDVININGDLYSRQGTSFDVRLILIRGRKTIPQGFAPLKRDTDKTVNDFEELYERVMQSAADDEKRLRIAKAKALARIKNLDFLTL